MDWHLYPIAATAIFILVDVVSGILKAAMRGELSSEKARNGVYHKSAYALIITCSLIIEWSMGFMDLGFGIPITVPACALISITEVMSILENVAVLNPDIAGTKLLGLFKSTVDVRDGKEGER